MSKIILVTGGNRGIGKEMCRQLAEKGHIVVMTSRDKGSGDAAARDISESLDVQLLDVTAKDTIQTLVDHIANTYGKLDVLINNAGVMSKADVLQLETEELDRLMKTNVYGPLQMIQSFEGLLKQSADPRVINVSSQMGALDAQTPDHSAYRLTKFTLNGLTLQLAQALPEMKVNAMHPGWVQTDMGGDQAPLTVEQGADTAVWLATEADIPTGKFFDARKVREW